MKSKDSIVEAYMHLVIEKKSSKITVKELCNKCNISRTTFYKHFHDTYHILEYILINDSINQTKALIDSHIDGLTVTEGWYMCFYKNKEFYYHAIKDESQNSLFNTLILQLTELNKQIYKDSILNNMSAQDIDYYAYKYASLQAMLLKKWIVEGMKVSPKDMARYYLNNLLDEGAQY